MDKFDDLPDEILNTKIWRLANSAEKAFGSVAITVAALLDQSITLDEGLHRIADAFSDSEEEFAFRSKDLVILEDFINGSKKREEISSYLALSEPTDDEKTEFYREKLISVIEESFGNPTQLKNREMENYWQSFQTRFSQHFSLKHDLIMKSHNLQEKFDEIMRSDTWWEFENLSKIPIFPQKIWEETQDICRRVQRTGLPVQRDGNAQNASVLRLHL